MNTDNVVLTKREAEALVEVIEISLFKMIRDDDGIDSIAWVETLVSVWRKCGGSYDDDDGGAYRERPKEYKG